jgi:hypothetical protein
MVTIWREERATVSISERQKKVASLSAKYHIDIVQA